jgi:integrating conjugative element protein (TIGR03765 family)
MRHSTPTVLWIVCLVTGFAQAEMLHNRQQQPTVVYEGHSTMSAQPYYQRLTRQGSDQVAAVTAPRGAGIIALEDRLPLAPDHLSVGPAEMKTVPGLITPLFIMGMDEVSLTWFGRAAQGLSDIGARGIVVQATQRSAWRALQQRARTVGIDLMLLEGDAIAQGYGISTYPTVLMSPDQARGGSHE